MNAAEPHTRALNRILEHCGPLDDDAEAQPAIGEELARLLLNALAGDHRRVSLRPIS
jgi:hypothetical protein